MSKYYLDYTGFSGLSKGAKIGLGLTGLSGLTALGIHALKERDKYKKFKESKGNENKSYLDYRKHRRFMKGVNKMRHELKDTGEIKIGDDLVYKPHSPENSAALSMEHVDKANSNYARFIKDSYKYSRMYPLTDHYDKKGRGILIRNSPKIDSYYDNEKYKNKDIIMYR